MGRATKLSAYGLPLVIGAGATLLSIPALIQAIGSTLWALVAVAQAVGAIAAVFIGFGWGAVGPARVAGMSATQRADYFSASILPRLLLAIAVAPFAVGIVALLGGGSTTAETTIGLCIVTVAFALSGLSAGWFFIGEASPWRLAGLDTAPRAAGVVVGSFAALGTSSLWAYAVSVLVGTVGAAILATVTTLRRLDVPATRVLRISRQTFASEQLAGFATAATSSLYISAPLLIFSAVSSAPIAPYALAERIYRLVLTALQPLSQIAQGYVPGSSGADPKRARTALLATGGAAAVVGASIAALTPWLSMVLSLGQVLVQFSVSVPLGVAASAVVMTRLIGLTLLVSSGRARSVALATGVGAVLGMSLTAVLAPPLGGTGVALAVMASEIAVLCMQAAALGRRARRDS